MEVNGLTGCCGIRELHGLSQYVDRRRVFDAQKALKDFTKMVYYPDHLGRWRDRWRFAIFAENRSYTYGREFMAFIKELGLGDVVESQRDVNPNSSNQLKVYLWTVNHEAVKAWMKDQKLPEVPKVSPTTGAPMWPVGHPYAPPAPTAANISLTPQQLTDMLTARQSMQQAAQPGYGAPAVGPVGPR